MTRRTLPALLSRHPIPAVLLIAGLGLMPGCAVNLQPCLGDPALDLQHDDPKCRIAGAIQAEKTRRLDLFPRLLENLDDPNGDVRLITGAAARKLSGLDPDFRSYASLAERQEAVARWRAWWEAQQHDGGPTPVAQRDGEASRS